MAEYGEEEAGQMKTAGLRHFRADLVTEYGEKETRQMLTAGL